MSPAPAPVRASTSSRVAALANATCRFTPESTKPSPVEMARRFAQQPEALHNTLAIAERCHTSLDFSQQRSLAADAQYKVEFANVRVAAGDRIGAAGSGWKTWDAVLHDAIILLAAWAMGGAERALEIAAAIDAR